MRNYEIVILFYVNKNTWIAEIIKKIIKIIIENKGLIKKFEDLGKLNLYYLIKNQKKAKIILINIQCEKYVIKQIEKKIKYNELIIRYIIVKKN
ncbi:30S ribosomal protein S6 [Candidatus Portiera aleyrodidarum]|uniref:Small ribosomal subunit protein bS6 n=1 Tax=Candidatus Portiera aleyrodidarum TV TaxID=1297582 RepID=A0A8D4BU81_9GAMM|nr:30S ribosomal protein S6 [Candidatus Portiera aleyrodidarum]AGI27153.1 ribosomal protein S6 [Candidatus Portiera aleyrodidarum TV]CEI59130.1 30S ribosomal protein S6 [Candidatus Portiera aleyrodidarum]